MNRTVYFFGAGATKAIAPEAPLNKDLVKKALEDFSTSSEAIRLKSFIDLLFRQRKEPFIDNQIWNLLDYIIQEDKSPCKAYNLEEIIELRKCLLNLIVSEFKKSLELAVSDWFERFIMKVSKDSAFISTNYDILIDIALSKLIGLNYGAKVRESIMEGPSEKNGMERAWRSPIPNINIGSIPLLKIHGSLSWLYCSKCDEVDITGSKEGVIKALSESYYCLSEVCTCKYEPLLITPTMFKNYNNRFIKEVWDYAEKELINAENLVFIGFALKDEDYQIRCLLMKALLNKKDRYKKVTVIEKEPDGPEDKRYLEENVKKKYNDLYGEIDFQPIGFKKYVDTLQKI